MMPIKRLQHLLDQALAACESTGPASVAERLMLFRPVTLTLKSFTDREALRLAATRKVRHLSRDLSTVLRDIETAAAQQGPHEEHVKRYYETAIRLKFALRELEQANEVITIYESMP